MKDRNSVSRSLNSVQTKTAPAKAEAVLWFWLAKKIFSPEEEPDPLLRLVGLGQHAGCGLCQDLMLGQFRSLLGKISIQDPATSTRSSIRDRRQVVDCVLKAVLKGTKITRMLSTVSIALSIVPRAFVALEADVTDRPDMDSPPDALMVGSLTSKSAAPTFDSMKP